MEGIAFAKGHGTGNDFVILPDLAGALDLTDSRVRALCDRRFGIGGDGVLRIMPATQATEGCEYFMDYRNADGSVAEMCGNGIRVFARYLVAVGWVQPGAIVIETRAGHIHVECSTREDVRVGMGTASPPLARAIPVIEAGHRSWPAVGVIVPNPHAVVFVDALDDAGDLVSPPVVPVGIFPDGANVEFVADIADRHIAMRVFERGVGETLSCGTGACAAAWAYRRREGEAFTGEIRVDVPGGTLIVDEDGDGQITLIGPANIIATGMISSDWWAAHP